MAFFVELFAVFSVGLAMADSAGLFVVNLTGL